MTYNYVNYRYFSVRFSEKARTFSLYHEKYGLIARDLTFEAHVRDLNHVYRKITAQDYGKVSTGYEKHLDSNALCILFSDGPEELPFITLRVGPDGSGVNIRLESERDADYNYIIRGTAVWGDTPETDTLCVCSKTKPGTLRANHGPAAPSAADGLFNRKNDGLLAFSQPAGFSYDFGTVAYTFGVKLSGSARPDTIRISISENVMAERYSMHYKCIRPKFDGTVPVGFMTWYALMWSANEETLVANIKAQAERLKKYGANIIWVDWEWYHNDFGKGNERSDSFTPDPLKYPKGMKYIADVIKEYGFIPAIWISPTHDVRVNEYLEKNPDILLVKRASWCGEYFFDPTNPKYLNEFLPLVFENIKKQGYRAIKWDTLPRCLDYYDEYHERFYDSTISSDQAMRNVVAKGREVLGDDVYMLSCHGEGSRDIMMYSDIFDAARIGADVFSWENFLESGVGRILKYYPLHNTAQYCDPDNLVLREQFNTRDQAISRVTLFSLLGLPLNIGDDLTVLSDERVDILARSIPALQVRPAELMEKTPEGGVLTVNTRIRTRLEEYNVVDIFNTTMRDIDYTLDFSELDLDVNGFYTLFDYWQESFLGVKTGSVKLSLKPCQSVAIAIRRYENRPQLVSVSRHIMQGASELKKLDWDGESLSGTVSVVGGEECRVYIYAPEGYKTRDTGISGLITLKLEKKENTDAGFFVEFEKK